MRVKASADRNHRSSALRPRSESHVHHKKACHADGSGKGMGATMALPLLDAMGTCAHAGGADGGQSHARWGIVYVPLGWRQVRVPRRRVPTSSTRTI